MSEWTEVKLGDVLVKITKGTTPPRGKGFVDDGINYIKSDAIGYDGRIDDSLFVSIDEETHEKFKRSQLEKDDILFSMAGVFLGKNAIVKEEHLPANTNQALAIIRLNQNLAKPQFVSYYLRQPAVIEYINNMSGQSAQPNINFQEISSIEIPLPNIEEQQNVIEVLSSLDDKIDLLHRQNQTLEQLAETLFRQWFLPAGRHGVEEADDDWEVLQLQDVAEVKNGFAFSSKSYVDYAPEHLEVLKMGHIERGGGLRTDPKRDYAPREERLERYILDKGDIVMAMTDMKDNVVILGVPAMIDESDRYVLNQRVARIYLKNRDSLINEYLLYVQLKDPDFIAELQSKANSGVQVNLSTASIKESEILIPPMELQLEKGNSITDLYLKKEYNDKQIKSLTKLRDTLLPKLMSGEVRIR
ncbi:MAG: restriction endonuclease subunit S [Bacteroidetes bacterium]|nr:restriction endonuclease subunit S [Bacteroidota bacterium]